MDLANHLLRRLAALEAGTGLLLTAVSGGADSVALLRLLVAANRSVAVAHFDHGLRSSSAADADFVRQLAERFGLPFRSGAADVAAVSRERGWNLEDGARRLRYAFLSRTARELEAERVLVAHTLDDQAETVLLQLLRGVAYPTGMPSRRGRLLRPLLDVERARLRAYLKEVGQEWSEDPSNLELGRSRNWLRRELLPLAETRFPGTARRLARLADLQRDVAAHLRSHAEGLAHDGGFRQSDLLAADAAVQREAIRLLLDDAGARRDFDRIEEVRSHLGDRHPYRFSIAPGKHLRLAYGRLDVARQGSPPRERPVRSAADLPPGVPEAALEHTSLLLRSRRPGDRIRLAGGSRKLSDVLIDRKVPREERDSLVVLASGSRVLWVEGIGLAAELASDSKETAEGTEESFMERALELAHRGARAGELPVGAVVVRDGRVLGEAHNETRARVDATAHAEVLAMRRAAEESGDWRLEGCTLYVTLEPCPMCFGAALVAHLPRLVYGARNQREGALGGVADLNAVPWKRELDVRGGLRAAEASALLSDFFASRRQGRG